MGLRSADIDKHRLWTSRMAGLIKQRFVYYPYGNERQMNEHKNAGKKATLPTYNQSRPFFYGEIHPLEHLSDFFLGMTVQLEERKY